MAENTLKSMENQLSQTMSTPVAPVTTERAYHDYMADTYGRGWVARYIHTPQRYVLGMPDYESWKAGLENEYNAHLADYQNYLQSAAYRKNDLESAGYNANYSDAYSMSPASPGNYSYSAPEVIKRDPFAMISNILSLFGQGTNIASQGIGTYMNVLSGLDAHKKSESDINLKHLTNNVQRLTLYKIATQLFGADNANNVVKWLEGGEQFIELPKGVDTVDSWLTSMLKEGPFSKSLSNEQQKTLAQILNLGTQTEGLETKNEIAGKESEMYTANKILMWLSMVAKGIASFL